MELPFEIGQVWWMPGHVPSQVTVPCPVCFGQRAVAVTLGDGEVVGVECDACGKGFERARGVIEEWVYAPQAIQFEIAGVDSMHQDRWWVRSTTGGSAEFSTLRATETEALAASETSCAEQYEANMRRRQHHRGNVKQLTWSLAYHRKQITDHQRQIAWHQSKIDLAVESRERA